MNSCASCCWVHIRLSYNLRNWDFIHACDLIRNYFLFLFLFLRVHFPKLPLYLGWPLQSTLKTSHKKKCYASLWAVEIETIWCTANKMENRVNLPDCVLSLERTVYNLLWSFLWRRSTDGWWQKMKDFLAVTGQVSCNRELITCPLMYIFGERERESLSNTMFGPKRKERKVIF